MSFISAVAGPSRIPYTAATRCGSICARRGYAAERKPRGERREGEEGSAEGQTGQRSAGFESLRQVNSQSWLREHGYKYKRPATFQKAKWIGHEVPYQSNPTFRPPPPLSDDYMNILNAELREGKRTVGQISQAHNVSKHRLEAIRKLKAVEDEFIRQNLPLQKAFQSSMEKLLGVESPLDQRHQSINLEASRSEELNRLSHPSTAAELAEEHQHAEIGSTGGAFGSTTGETGLQKDQWEFQDETTYLANEKAHAAAAAARKQAELDEIASGVADESKMEAAIEEAGAEAAAATGVAIPTPKAPKKAPTLPQTTAKTSKSTYRFVDTSSLKEKRAH